MVARTNNTVMTVGQVSDLTRKQMIGTRTLSSSSFFYEANDVLDDSKERERERERYFTELLWNSDIYSKD